MVEKFENQTKIEKPKKPEDYYEDLNDLLKQISQRINQENQAKNSNLVNEDCTIDMDGFKKVIPENKINRDKKYIKEQDLQFAPDPTLESVQAYYNTNNPDKIIETWQKNKKKSDGPLMEMAVTSIFYKVLKEKFLVVRASAFDDYHNGVDNVLVDKETGQVICAFDEIRVSDFKNDEDNFKKKVNKINNKIFKGGTRLDYGVTYEKETSSNEPQLKKQSIKNLPIFWLALSKKELTNLLSETNYNLDEKPSETELEMFDKLIGLIKGQKKALTKTEVQDKLRKNLDGIDKVLEKIKALRQELN